MKYFIFAALLSGLFCKVSGQVVIEENPSYTIPSNKPFINKLMDAAVLGPGGEAAEIRPDVNKICFDKKIKVKTNTLKGPSEVCLFINTKIGLVAYTSLKPGSIDVCNIKPEQPDFSLSVIGLKGNLYTYFNVKKKSGIEHRVITGNSNRFLYQYAATEANSTLYKKDEQKEYLGGKVKAWAYKYENRPEKWFIFGKTLPDAVIMQPFKYLGNFGVGFQYTDKGLFLIMEISADSYGAEILSIEDMPECFNPAGFTMAEDEAYHKIMQDIKKDREKLERAQGRVKTDDCPELQYRIIQHQYAMLNKREENLRQSAMGNLQQDMNALNAKAAVQFDYEGIIQANIYETQFNICRTQKKLRNATGSNRVTQQEKLDCLKEQLAAETESQKQILLISAQYPKDAGKRISEQAKVYLRNLTGCN